ncbi:hypothetical protein TCAL_11715 [Tigriopus californicus]|uniref:Uncharacterized protein n=1 Tax=Tigriopus californicus TaxID=6832 RepID=A0A553NAZ2_TIGCA|nr:LIM/homeobox protein Lhx6-like isoform X2 [Tigriopus californicus]TRY62587.1 hypothetical protein TCAL_11715 [Tigriopus californicus]|eukprot:TCALIF_11715-PA protein Name:"Similar to Lhx2 LIM/homeobox protein Lhx2 (Mus musculus)" AED:0.02 eAED:0.02 QI:329/1/1/1/0.66/0.75/4/325/502
MMGILTQTNYKQSPDNPGVHLEHEPEDKDNFSKMLAAGINIRGVSPTCPPEGQSASRLHLEEEVQRIVERNDSVDRPVPSSQGAWSSVPQPPPGNHHLHPHDNPHRQPPLPPFHEREYHSPYPLPPPPPPLISTPHLSGHPNQGGTICEICKGMITDEYIYSVEKNRVFHEQCLACAECHVPLHDGNPPIEHNGLLLCSHHFHSKFAPVGTQCSRCGVELQFGDTTMFIKPLWFHEDCFRCHICDTKLKKGESFGKIDGIPYCHVHYSQYSQMNYGIPFQATPPHLSMPQGQFHPLPPIPVYGGDKHLYPHFHNEFGPSMPSHAHPQGGPHGHPQGLPQGQEFFGAGEPMHKKRRGRKKRKAEVFQGMNGYVPNGYPAPDGTDGTKKRARTSFKHNQLRVMKGHFQINQNPDSRELKMLAQKTGLDKKVLQVWFQNARAKWRRNKSDNMGGTEPGNAQCSVQPGLKPGPCSSGSGSSTTHMSDDGGGYFNSVVMGEISPSSI